MSGKITKRLLSGLIVALLLLGMLPGVNAVVSAEQVSIPQLSHAEREAYAGIQTALTRTGLVGFTGDHELPDDTTPVNVIVMFRHLPARTAVIQAAARGVKLTTAAAKRDAAADHDLFRAELNAVFPASARTRSAVSYDVTAEYHTALNGVAITLPANALADIAKFDSVHAIYPDETIYQEPINLTDDAVPFGNKEGGATGRAAMGVDELHEDGIDGTGVKVCVIDTGIDYNHPAFEGVFETVSPRGAVFNDVDLKDGYFYGRNFINDEYTSRADNDPMETTWAEYRQSGEPETQDGQVYYSMHGTHVSGTIVAQDVGEDTSALGVAPGATLWVYRVFGTYSTSSVSVILSAIEMVDTDKPDVVNMSMGATVNNPYHLYSVAVNNIILNNPDIVFAVSAGNSGEGGMRTLGSPAAAPSVITVGNASPEQTRVGVNVAVRTAGSVLGPWDTPYNYYTIYPFYLPDETWYTETGAVNAAGDPIVDVLGFTPGEPGDVLGGSPYSLLTMPNTSDVEPGNWDAIGVGTEADFRTLAGGFDIDDPTNPGNPSNPIAGNVILVRRGNDFLDTMARAKAYGASAIILFNRGPYHGEGVTDGLESLRGVSEEYIPFYVILDYNDGINLENDLLYTEYAGGQFELTGPEHKLFPAALEASSSNGPVGQTHDIKPDVVSDGANVLSTVPIMSDDGTYADAYARAGGTSMSSPHVAGAAALTRQYSNDHALDWKNDEIKTRLMNTAIQLPKEGDWSPQDIGVYRQGAGFVHVKNAIESDTVIMVAPENNGLIEAVTDTYASFNSGSFSFGWVDVDAEDVVTRSLTASVTNNSSAPITYDIRYADTYVSNYDMRYVSAAAGYYGETPATIAPSVTELTVAAGATESFDLILTVPTEFDFIGSVEGYVTVTGGNQTITLPAAAYARTIAPPLAQDGFFANRPVISTGAEKQSPYSSDLDILINLQTEAAFYAYVLDYEKSQQAVREDGTLDIDIIFEERAIIGDTGFSTDLTGYPVGEWYTLNDVVLGGSYISFSEYDELGAPLTYGTTQVFREGLNRILLYAMNDENDTFPYYVDFYVDNTPPTIAIDNPDEGGDYLSYLADADTPVTITGTVYDDAVDALIESDLAYHIWEEGDPLPSVPDQQFTALWAYARGAYTQAEVDADGSFTLTLPAGAVPADVTLYAIDGFSLKSFGVFMRGIEVAEGFDPAGPSLGDYCQNELGLDFFSNFGFIGSNVTSTSLRLEDGAPAMLLSADAISVFPGERKTVVVSLNGAAKRAGHVIQAPVVANATLADVELNGVTVAVTGRFEGSTNLTISTDQGLTQTIAVDVPMNPGHGVVLHAGSYMNLGSMEHLIAFEQTIAFDGAFDPAVQVYENAAAPILWRVMGNEILSDGSEGALHIFSEYILEAIRFGARGDGRNHFDDGPDFNPHHWLNGGYAVRNAEGGWVADGAYIDSYFFKNFSDGELNAIPTVDNQVTAYSIFNDQPNAWREAVAHNGKFYLPWVVIKSTDSDTAMDINWSMNDGLDARNSLVGGLALEGFGSVPSDLSAATFRDGTPHSYWTETPSEGDVRLFAVRADGSLTLLNVNTQFDGLRPGATLDLSKVVYAALDTNNAERVDGDVYKLTVVGSSDIGSFTGDILNAAMRNVDVGAAVEVSGTVTGDYDRLMYKIVDSSSEIVQYGEASYADGRFTMDLDDVAVGVYKIYLWAQKDDALRSNLTGDIALLNVNVRTDVTPGELSELIEAAELLTSDDYTPASWAVFAAALDAAKATLADENATQVEIDAAYTALVDARNALVDRGDAADLAALIAIADALVQSDYTASSWTAFAAALDAAKATLADENATQAEIDAAYTALEEAKDALVGKAPTPTPGGPTAPAPSGSTTITVVPKVNADGAAVATSKATEIEKAIAAAEKNDAAHITISVDAPASQLVGGLEVVIPAVTTGKTLAEAELGVTIKTASVTVSFDHVAIDEISNAGDGDIVLTVDVVDLSEHELSDADAALIGDRPVYSFAVRNDGNLVSDFRLGKATVSIPYTLAADENPEAIIVCFISDDGTISTVRGHYDPTLKSVVIITNHFSVYAVGYNPVSFTDVPATYGSRAAIDYIAARGITTGIGGGKFGPEATLTRGQFLVMIMRAYGIAPDTDLSDNFTDAGNDFMSGYMAAAKRLGLSAGTGNNAFSPDRAITRQELFTLVYNALRVIGELPTVVPDAKKVSEYEDFSGLASWATDAVTLLVESKTIQGDGVRLLPDSLSQRYQMAQLIYNLMR